MTKRTSYSDPIPAFKGIDFYTALSLADLTERVSEFAAEIGVDPSEVTFAYEYAVSPDAYSDDSVVMYALRPPTEKEIAKRKAKADRERARRQKEKEAKEAREKAEYERLRAKYGTN